MRVLVLDRALTNSYTWGLAGGLRANGIDVRVAGPVGEPGVAAHVFRRSGVEGRTASKLGDTMLGPLRFQLVLNRFRPDVVHVQWPTPADTFFALQARVRRIPVVFTVHNPKRRLGDPRSLESEVLVRLAAATIVHGPRLQQDFAKEYPGFAGTSHVVPLGNYEHAMTTIERAEARRQLGLDSDCTVFAFIGQLRPRKGLESLLRAYHGLRAGTTRPTVLLIVGSATDPAYFRRLQDLANDLSIEVRWATSEQSLPHIQLDRAIAAADQVVLPFESASHSASLILAMTHGACVVSTDVGEIGNSLWGRGIVVPRRDVEALATAMERALSDPGGCRALGEAARRYAVEELSWAALAERTIEAYCAAIAR